MMKNELLAMGMVCGTRGGSLGSREEGKKDVILQPGSVRGIGSLIVDCLWRLDLNCDAAILSR